MQGYIVSAESFTLQRTPELGPPAPKLKGNIRNFMLAAQEWTFNTQQDSTAERTLHLDSVQKTTVVIEKVWHQVPGIPDT